MGYSLPSDTDWVTANHYNHCCERNPPSSEPGTDYGSAYGSPTPVARTLVGKSSAFTTALIDV